MSRAPFLSFLLMLGVSQSANAASWSTATWLRPLTLARRVLPWARSAAPTSRRPYTARITGQTPLALGIALDQSGSTKELIETELGRVTRAQAMASAVDANLEGMLALSMHDQDEVTGEPRFKSWFKVYGVGYSLGVRQLIGSGTQFASEEDLAKTATWLDEHGAPARRPEQFVQMKWIEPVSENRTDMGQGFQRMLPAFRRFVRENPDAPAPVIMNFTDGLGTRGVSPVRMAKKLKRLKTRDGNLLLFNVHLGEGASLMFPTPETLKQVLDQPISPEARGGLMRLYEMSSPLPPGIRARAQAMFPEYEIGDGARAMVYNASGMHLTQLLELGTIQNMHARE